MRKLLIGLAVVIALAAGAVYFWAQTVLGSEPVRAAIARQLSAAIGQPVQIGRIRAALFPRVTIALGDVGIGMPERITITHLDLGTDLGALLSRRIEHATVSLAGGRVELPLPHFAFQDPTAASSDPALQLVSIDEIIVRDTTVVSGGRTLSADLDLMPGGSAVEIRRASLKADGTDLAIAGRLTDASAPAGTLTVTASALDAPALLAFVQDFSVSATPTEVNSNTPNRAPSSTAGGRPTMNLDVTLTTGRATFGALVLDSVSGRARVTTEAVAAEPIRFGVFGGRAEGRLALTLGATPGIDLRASISGVDMNAVMQFAGSPGALTGRLAATLDVTSRGTAAADVLAHAQGGGRVDIEDGMVQGLGLVRTVVVATSGRTGTSLTDAPAGDSTFSRLGATLAIRDGVARTTDLRFESPDVLMTGEGSFALNGTRVALDAQLQLSDALSKQAGRDLVRYTARDGRVTLPATVSGRVGDLHVQIDALDVAKRAITNRATEEAGKAIRRGVDRLLGR